MTDEQMKKARELETALADAGKIIEGGFAGFSLMSILPDATQEQKDFARSCFFAGAAHLFSTLMNVVEPGGDVTDNDLKRLSLVEKELQTFIEGYVQKLPTEGNA